MHPTTALLGPHGPPSFLARFPRTARAWCVAALPLLGACVDRSVTLPDDEPDAQAFAAAECTVSVREQSMVCTYARLRPAATRVRGDKILGGQEVYLRLASSSTAYHPGSETLTTRVTLQNLLRQSMGTEDGTTMTPVRVFFQQKPTVTVGTGTASVVGDGLDTFTGSNQPYYNYSQIILPYEVSDARTWTFNVSPGVTTFVFSVYVSAPLADPSGTLLGNVWTGSQSADWGAAGNWQGGAAPDSASTVAIPPDSLLTAHTLPALDADRALTNLRVGYGSTVALGGFTLSAWGNVDAVGAVNGGTLWMRGTGVLGGTVDALKVSGSATLQKATTATGAVSVRDGTLSVSDQVLTVRVP
jgi:hypothetical protein